MQSFFSARKPEAVANEGGIFSPPPSIKYGHYLLPCLHAAYLKLLAARVLAVHIMVGMKVPLPGTTCGMHSV